MFKQKKPGEGSNDKNTCPKTQQSFFLKTLLICRLYRAPAQLWKYISRLFPVIFHSFSGLFQTFPNDIPRSNMTKVKLCILNKTL